MVILTPNGEKLFEGSKQACKKFIRENKIKRFTTKDSFEEKVVAVAEVGLIKEEEEIEKPSFFGGLFGKDE